MVTSAESIFTSGRVRLDNRIERVLPHYLKMTETARLSSFACPCPRRSHFLSSSKSQRDSIKRRTGETGARALPWTADTRRTPYIIIIIIIAVVVIILILIINIIIIIIIINIVCFPSPISKKEKEKEKAKRQITFLSTTTFFLPLPFSRQSGSAELGNVITVTAAQTRPPEPASSLSDRLPQAHPYFPNPKSRSKSKSGQRERSNNIILWLRYFAPYFTFRHYLQRANQK